MANGRKTIKFLQYANIQLKNWEYGSVIMTSVFMFDLDYLNYSNFDIQLSTYLEISNSNDLRFQLEDNTY